MLNWDSRMSEDSEAVKIILEATKRASETFKELESTSTTRAATKLLTKNYVEAPRISTELKKLFESLGSDSLPDLSVLIEPSTSKTAMEEAVDLMNERRKPGTFLGDFMRVRGELGEGEREKKEALERLDQWQRGGRQTQHSVGRRGQHPSIQHQPRRQPGGLSGRSGH